MGAACQKVFTLRLGVFARSLAVKRFSRNSKNYDVCGLNLFRFWSSDQHDFDRAKTLSRKEIQMSWLSTENRWAPRRNEIKKGVRSLNDKSDEWRTRSQPPDEKTLLCALASLREIRLLIDLLGTRITTKFVDSIYFDFSLPISMILIAQRR